MDVFILKAAHHLNTGIHLADVREELVAETFALAGTLDEPCDIDELDGRRNDLFRACQHTKPLHPRVGNIHHADIRLNGAEGKIRRLGLAAPGECVEES